MVVKNNFLNRRSNERAADISMGLGKLPPQDVESEKAALCAAMFEKSSTDNTIPYLQAEDFYKEAHQRIWLAMSEMYQKGEDIDLLTVTTKLRSKGELEICGGAQYLTQLSTYLSMTSHVNSYINSILETSKKRKLILISSIVLQRAFDDMNQSEDIKNEILASIEKMDASKVGEDKTIGEIVKETIEDIFSDAPSGVPVVLEPIRKLLISYELGSLICIGARPSVGKTAFVLNELYALAEMGILCDFFSIEMTAKAVMIRLISKRTRIPLTRIRDKKCLTEQERQQIREAEEYIKKLPLRIIDKGISHANGLKTKVKKAIRSGSQLCAVDYLQLIEGGEGDNRNSQLDSITRDLKNIFKEGNVPGLLLSQLKRSDKKEIPQLDELRDSGAIEQHIDVCMMLHSLWRVGILKDDEGYSTEFLLEAGIVKNRQGPLGTAELYFKKDTVEVLPPQPKVRSIQHPGLVPKEKKKGGFYDDQF